MQKNYKKSLSFKCKFLSNYMSVRNAIQQSESWLLARHVPSNAIENVAIVLAEASNNIVKHAYPYCKNGTVDLHISLQSMQIDIYLSDHGAILPALPKKNQIILSKQNNSPLPENGFGWLLIHSLTDEVRYYYDCGRNHLHICMSSRLSLLLPI